MMRVSMGEPLDQLTWPAAGRRHAVPAPAAPVVSLTGDGLDYPLLQGIVVTGACFVVPATLVAGLVLGWLDPCVRT